jgi:hypothetical protein
VSEVWLIESGEYSNYRVHAVALSEEDAIEICRRANVPLNDYNQWEYSARSIVQPADVVLTYTAWARSPWDWEEDEGLQVDADVGFEVQVEGVIFDTNSTVAARADSPERARKIAQDRAAQREAEALGL